MARKSVRLLMDGHTIRLRGPWELVRDGSACRVALPADPEALGGGTATLRRRFGRPPRGNAWLRIESAPGLAAARLNGEELALHARGDGWRSGTVALRPTNLLELVACLPGAGPPWGEVALIVVDDECPS